jgi:hypothetical protein
MKYSLSKALPISKTVPMKRLSSPACLALLLSLTACSGGGDGNDSPDAALPLIDSGVPAADATQQSACGEASDVPNQGVIDGVVAGSVEEDYLSIANVIVPGPPEDTFLIELYGGFGVFENGIVPGVYPITGDETDYNTCGACVSLFADFVPNQGPSMIYVAQSGTLTVTSVEGNFVGSYAPDGATAELQGQELDDAQMAYQRRPDCTLSAGGASWDKLIPVPPTGTVEGNITLSAACPANDGNDDCIGDIYFGVFPTGGGNPYFAAGPADVDLSGGATVAYSLAGVPAGTVAFNVMLDEDENVADPTAPNPIAPDLINNPAPEITVVADETTMQDLVINERIAP